MYRIVIADDEEYVRDLLAKNINQSRTDFQVIGKADNGQDALKMVEELKPDVLITDICMPVLTGLELIRGIQKLSSTVKTVIISGYDDFSYAKQAVSLGVTEYLLKPFSPDELYEVLNKIKSELEHQKTLMANIQEMKDQLADSRQMFQEQILRDLLQKTGNEEAMAKEAERAGIDLEVEYFAAGILKIYQNLRDGEHGIKDFLEMIKDTYFPPELRTCLVRMHQNQIAVLFLGDYRNSQSFKRAIRNGLTAIGESMEKYYDIKTVCIVGGIYREYQKLADSYQEALSVWRGTLDKMDTVIFYEDEIFDRGSSMDGQRKRPQELEQQLLLQIQMGKEEKAEESLYEILRYYEQMDVKQSDFISVSLVELVFDISEALVKAGGQGPIWEDEKVIRYLREHFTYGSLRDAGEVLRGYLYRCCRQFADMNEKQGERIVSQVKELMEQNLNNEEFGLELASAKLFYSQNYIRQIFKQITGESFMEYLIRRRMETAGELLRNSTMKIQEVAENTGYSNQRYFASCFKKYYGSTPTEYRNNQGMGPGGKNDG